MENITFDFDNVISQGGLIISIMGMIIVFLSLAFISLFIKFLPKILGLLDNINKPKSKKPVAIDVKTDQSEEAIDEGIEAAICAVIALEIGLNNFGDDQRITLDAFGDVPTAWATAGKMRSLSKRIAS
jgi:Na+-transporting methylmalonyl-CoA/oxaloacetate decarboxylase gamma subunit